MPTAPAWPESKANAAGWGPLVPDVVQVDRDDVSALERVLEQNAGRVAAFIGEPVQGAAGVYPPVEGYWPAVRDLCRQHDVLLIADEVVCGFGRLGSWFGSERFDIQPDLMVGAKGLTSGYAPVGMVLAGSRCGRRDVVGGGGDNAPRLHLLGSPRGLRRRPREPPESSRRRTWSSALPRSSRASAPPSAGSASHSLVREVRSCGLLAAVELTESALELDALKLVHLRCRDEGVLTRMLVGRALQFSPPFVIERGRNRLARGPGRGRARRSRDCGRMNRFDGMVVAVTGASLGIGAEIAARVIEEGGIVVGVSRREEPALELVDVARFGTRAVRAR